VVVTIADPGGKAQRVIGASGDLDRRERTLQLLGRCFPVQGHREALEVVDALPIAERAGGLIE